MGESGEGEEYKGVLQLVLEPGSFGVLSLWALEPSHPWTLCTNHLVQSNS
jgi:hypothetical protein